MVEIVVVGGGLAGCAAALELAARGAAVNVIEPHRPGSAATGASAGMLAPQYESSRAGPFFRALLESRVYAPQFFAHLEELTGERLDLRFDGMLVANRTEEEHGSAKDMAEWQTAAGASNELLDPSEAERLQPGITSDAISWTWLSQEGQVDTQKLATSLPRALQNAGVRLLSGRHALRLRARETAVSGVELDGGRFIGADAVVLAAGAWSGQIGGVPVEIPVRPVRGHLVRFAAGEVPLVRLVAGHAGRYLVPRADGSVLAGSTMDESGFDRSISDESLNRIQSAAWTLVPDLASRRVIEYWADLRPVTRDGLPIVGADPHVDNLFYATGYGRNGILFSPLAGRMLAEHILGAPMPAEWKGLLPSAARWSQNLAQD
jgi:glycine oxidase